MRVGNHTIGDNEECRFIAEIGINHNGSMRVVHQLIQAAAQAGADYVKFQKRTVSKVYTKEELDAPRQHPWGTTNRELKEQLELELWQYKAINNICSEFGVQFLVSCWDTVSVEQMSFLKPAAYKVASATLTDHDLLAYTCSMGRPIIMSTGMSTIEEIEGAVGVVKDIGNPLILMHCTSTYPTKDTEINLACIQTLRQRFGVHVGYSGHELGIATTVAAVALGARLVERHITLDRAMFGSDQAASLEPQGFTKLVRDCKAVQMAMGDGKKVVYDSEKPILRKLRKVKTGV